MCLSHLAEDEVPRVDDPPLGRIAHALDLGPRPVLEQLAVADRLEVLAPLRQLNAYSTAMDHICMVVVYICILARHVICNYSIQRSDGSHTLAPHFTYIHISY